MIEIIILFDYLQTNFYYIEWCCSFNQVNVDEFWFGPYHNVNCTIGPREMVKGWNSLFGVVWSNISIVLLNKRHHWFVLAQLWKKKMLYSFWVIFTCVSSLASIEIFYSTTSTIIIFQRKTSNWLVTLRWPDIAKDQLISEWVFHDIQNRTSIMLQNIQHTT